MSALAPDVDIVEILVRDDEPPCLFEGCSTVARWATRCPSCRFDWQICDEHRKYIDSGSRLWLGVTCDADSGGCGGRIFYPLTWRPI